MEHNAISKIFHELSDADLAIMLDEMQTLESTGVLPGGKVRELARLIEKTVGASANDARHIAESGVFRTAAYRWRTSV